MNIEKAKEVYSLMGQYKYYTRSVRHLSAAGNLQGASLMVTMYIDGLQFDIPRELLPEIRKQHEKLLDAITEKILDL